MAAPSSRTEQQSDDDPGVADDLEVHERADDGHQHAELGQVHAALGGFGMAQALQSENEKDRSEQVTEFDEVGLPVHLMRKIGLSVVLVFVLCSAYGFIECSTLTVDIN